jgi:hypothetical protein
VPFLIDNYLKGFLAQFRSDLSVRNPGFRLSLRPVASFDAADEAVCPTARGATIINLYVALLMR